MTTELESPELTDEEHLVLVMKEQRDRIAAMSRVADKCEGLIRKLPRDLRHLASVNAEGMDFFNCNHEQAVTIMRHLALGRWERKVNSHHADLVDYIVKPDGLDIRIWAAQPPGSCRIVEEEIEVPAHKETIRRLICA